MRVSALIALLLAVVVTGCDSTGDDAARPATEPLLRADDTSAAVTRCKRQRRPPVRRSRLPTRFFPTAASALWPAGSARERCLYLLPPTGRPRPLWRIPDGERLARLGWTPDGATFVATTLRAGEAHTYLVGRDGRVTTLPDAEGVGFLRDGTAVVARKNALFVRARGRERRLVSLAAVVSAAGLGSGASVVVAPDAHGFVRGYGADAVIASVFATPRVGPWQALVLITRSGTVRRLTQPFRGGAAGSAAGRAWSPDGRQLAQAVGELPGRTGLPQAHEHCLDLWTERRGYRRLVCGADLPNKRHFDRLLWSRDGSSLLLDNGVVVTAAGRAVGQVAIPPVALALQWSE